MRTRAWLAAAVLACAAGTAAADLDVRSQVGCGGRWIVDAATPLVVELSNTGRDPLVVTIVIKEGEGALSSDVVHQRVVQVPAGGARGETFLVPGPRGWSGALSVELETDLAVPIHTPTELSDRGSIAFDVAGTGGFSATPVQYAAQVLGVLGDANGRIAGRFRSWERGGAAGGNVAQRELEALALPPEYLRLAPLGLDGFDAVILCDPDAQTCAEPAARDGLLEWIALGGTLVVSLGEHAGSFSASPLAAEMPATWTGAERTSYAALLADLGTSTTATDAAGPWVALTPGPSHGPGVPGAHDGSPLRVERLLGRGRIVLVPFDLRTAMLLPGVDDFGVSLLCAPFVEPPPERTREVADDWIPTDYSAPIGRTLQAGAFEPPPLALVVLGILLYVVVVGPLDWVVLKRLKKERLTTLTFLGTVVTFTLLAYGASLLLFSSGARVNRIVIADLVEAGGDRGQLLRFMDITGYYSPTGSDEDVSYPGRAVLLSPSMPGSNFGGDVGSVLPVTVASADPLHPRANVQLAFRSQRVVRFVGAGTLGSTIDVEWKDDGVRVVNGLPVDLDDVRVYVAEDTYHALGSVASGATSKGGRFESARQVRARPDANGFGGYWGDDASLLPDQVRGLLETMTIGPSRAGRAPGQAANDIACSRKAGVELSRAFARGHALVVAHASKFPQELPGASVAGSTYVVIRKEVEFR